MALDDGVHGGELGAAADRHGVDGGVGGEDGVGIERGSGLADETDARDGFDQGDGPDGLVEKAGDVDDAIGAPAVGERADLAGPVGCRHVVDDVVRAEVAQP